MLQGAKVVSVNEESCIVSWITFIHFRSLTITNTVTSCCVTPTLHIDPNHSVLRIPAATPRTNAFWGKTSWTHRYFRALHCKRWWHVSMYQLYLNHLGRIIAVHRPQECLKLDSLHSKYKPVFRSFWGVTWSNIPKNWSNYYHRNQWREPHPQPMTLAADPIKLWMHDQ